MPLITVYGIGINQLPSTLAKALRDACLQVQELKLNDKRDVTVYPIASDIDFTNSDPLIIVVELLFDKPERTAEVRKKLAEALGKAAKTLSPNRPVEVAVKRFNPEKDAFWTG